MIEYLNHSLHIKDSILWLDANTPKDLSFLSHFSQNYIKHDRVIASRESAYFLRKFSLSRIPLNILQLSNFKKFSIGDLSISLYPSGSNLGASQILVKKNNTKILYSGLVNTNDLDMWEEVYYPSTDYLIFKTNYGEEKYIFPKVEDEFKNLIDYIETNNKRKKHTLIFTYSFGLAQLIIKNLSHLDLPIYLQNRVFDYSSCFKKLKVDLGSFKKLSKQLDKIGIIIYPLDKINYFSDIDNSKNVFISPEVPSKEIKEKLNIDKHFIISNEADFLSSIKFIENISPQKLYVLPGKNKDLVKYFEDKIYVKTFNDIKQKSLF